MEKTSGNEKKGEGTSECPEGVPRDRRIFSPRTRVQLTPNPALRQRERQPCSFNPADATTLSQEPK